MPAQNLVVGDRTGELKAWFDRIAARPATQRAYEIAKNINVAPTVDEASKKVLFGQDASSVQR